MTVSPAIVILGPSALATARRIQALYPQAVIHGLSGRVEADQAYDDFGDTLRSLYRSNAPIIALCAAGIVIRSLAPLLASKGAEPPVLAVAEDGSAVVPLLGGLAGVNRMAREMATALQVSAAITTSGELRFGTCLLDPPSGYVLADIEQGKRFVSDLLGGERLGIEGDAPWLDRSKLPMAENAGRTLHITPLQRPARPDELLIHPRTLLALVDSADDLAARIGQAFEQAGLAQKSLAALLAPPTLMTDKHLAQVASDLAVPLRFIGAEDALPPQLQRSENLQLLQAASPEAARAIGRPRGRLSVIGLGPGAAEHMTPAVRRALDEAEDLLGYETYVKMAEPLRPEQVRHSSDNREELQRARHAFELAAGGRRVVVISSGDPGVFAMAAAVLEALQEAEAPADWHAVELQILPGVSAALATAAKAGAPLGHDFCLISLSDNLKPWSVIENRLDHAGAADLAMAFYNPISKARPWQLGRALEIVRMHRTPDTVVVLGRDIGRPAEALRVLSLGELTAEMVDMRTLVIIGSSQTRRFPRGDDGEWVYTPRSYPQP
ncbi:precorrin-3B C(17)-methyltransferase [Pseudomonas fulva]|uniref:precorrin-3B C(17)-methyltransferase n=1 Tax=Pseudomonas fulva TaxID=47880 RepID=UPI00201DE4F8|nr:precorrin-3B C(17)-methyltransferase [Pseudomonas fulva]UQY36827.1 precorrin-3B C(17)-methyltransferase [Pseudomonas fulva]